MERSVNLSCWKMDLYSITPINKPYNIRSSKRPNVTILLRMIEVKREEEELCIQLKVLALLYGLQRS